MTPNIQVTKAKIDKWDYNTKQKPTLYSKGNNQQNKKATHRMGENICKPCI